MSRNIKQVVNSKKPYCKVCHDAGKPESEYSSHWVKSLPDRTGKTSITCPTLLSTECRYCFKHGHTAKFCPVIEKNNKEKEKAERRQKAEEARENIKSKTVAQKKPSSLFELLAEDSSDKEDAVVVSKKMPTEEKVSKKIPVVVEEFPALGVPAKKVEISLPKVQPEMKTGWAAALAKPKEDIFMRDLEERSIMKQLPQSALKRQTSVAPMPPMPPAAKERDYNKKIYTKSWADWTDSDSDEEEDYNPSAFVKNTVPNSFKAVESICVEDNWDEDW
jgi:hypothetical protein